MSSNNTTCTARLLQAWDALTHCTAAQGELTGQSTVEVHIRRRGLKTQELSERVQTKGEYRGTLEH